MAISKIETESLDTALNAPTATALSTASGSAPSYSARAWVNFNGTGTVAIRASGNVSSITDNGTANYTVNFATNMPDTDYSAVGITGAVAGSSAKMLVPWGAQTVSACRIAAYVWNASQSDSDYVSVAIFR